MIVQLKKIEKKQKKKKKKEKTGFGKAIPYLSVFDKN